MTINDLLLSGLRPTSGGTPVGHADWRLSVELATAKSMWGRSKWGAGVWATDWSWLDLTPQVLGQEWTRGQQNAAERPRAGTCKLSLKLPDDGSYAPWLGKQYPFLDQGSILRCIAWQSTGGPSACIKQWVMKVESITEQPVVQDAYRTIEVQLVEHTYSALAALETAPVAAAGAGESLPVRLARLFTGWKYGSFFPSGGPLTPAATMQATTLTANRLAEVQLTCDSADVTFFQARNGWATTRNRPPAASARPLIDPTDAAVKGMLGERTQAVTWADLTESQILPYSAPPTVRTDDERITEARYLRVGGTVRVATDASRGNGPRVVTRTDLICETDLSAAQIAANELQRLNVPTTVTVTTDAFMDSRLYYLAMILELFELLPIWRELTQQPAADGYVFEGYVMQMVHTVTGFNTSQLSWKSQYTTAVTSAYPGPPVAQT